MEQEVTEETIGYRGYRGNRINRGNRIEIRGK